MAQRRGQIVVGTLVPPDTESDFPVVDSNDIGGGRHIVATKNERDNIRSKLRKAAMIVHVLADNTDYQLLPGYPATGPLSDSNWKSYSPGVPDNVITEHQKVEDIEYETAAPFSKLADKLADIDSKIGAGLTTHNTVEQIKYGDSVTSGFEYLTQKLDSMNSAISSAAVIPDIESIAWGTMPTDGHSHATSLDGEIENLYSVANDPNKIIVTEMDYVTKLTLQQKLDQLTMFRPPVEEIANEDGTALMSIITDAGDIDYIKYDVRDEPTITLRQKLDKMDTATQDLKDSLDSLEVYIENVSWSSVPTDGHSHAGSLSGEIENIYDEFSIVNSSISAMSSVMNDPNEIIVTIGGSSSNLNDAFTSTLSSLSSAISNITIENVSWNSVPSDGHTHAAKLGDELENIYGDLSDIDTTLDDMNDPNKIIVTIGGASTNLNNAFASTLASLSAAVAGSIQGIENVSWNNTPAGHSAALDDEINYLYSVDNDLRNDLTSLTNNVGSLSSTLDTVKDVTIPDIQTALLYPPQVLIFTLTDFALGAHIDQEYLTVYDKSKIDEVTIYTDGGSILAGNTSVIIETCTNGSTYTGLGSNRVFTLASSDAKKMKTFDTSSDNYVLDILTRIRINLSAIATASEINTLMIRLKLSRVVGP